METSTKQARHARTWWIVVALIAVVVTAFFVLRGAGDRRLKRAIKRVELEGQALTPAYLPIPKNAGKPDPTEWLTRVARSRPAWTMSDLSDPAKYAFLLDEARANRIGEDARIAFETFDVVLRKFLEGAADSSAKWNELWVSLAVRLRKCDGVQPWGELNEAAVRLLAVGLAQQLTLARQAAAYGEIDPVREASSLESANEAFPKLPVLEEAVLADAVHVTAVHKAQAGYALEALDALRAGLAMARIHSSPRWLMSKMVWALQMLRVLDGLQTILPTLPRGLDVADIENELAAARPRAALAQAIRGERAFGYHRLTTLYEDGVVEAADTLVPISFFQRLTAPLVGDTDRAEYLEALTDGANRAEQVRHLRAPAFDGVQRSLWTPFAAAFAPSLEPSLHTSDLLETRLLLARVALVAYRAGAKDALQFLSTTADPFDGRPIRCGFGEKGLVVFWSVGPDGKDDGAVPDSDDIAWGLKLPE